MRFTCTAGALAETLSFPARVLDAKAVRKFAILGTTLIRAADGVVSFTASDLDRLAISEMEEVEVASPGTRAAGLERLVKLAENFKEDATLTIIADESAARVSCGRSHYRLPLLPVEDFPPQFAPGEGAARITLGVDEVGRAFGATQFADLD
jgi:DNA polymerase-3 subunit beta